MTAVIVTYNGEDLIAGLAETIAGLGDVACAVYDGGSRDGTCGLVKSLIPQAKLITGANLGFGHGCNRCLENTETRYTLFLNSDAKITRESLGILTAFLEENEEYAAVQPLVRLWDWKPVTASRGVFLTEYGEAWDSGFMHLEPFVPGIPFDVPGVTAAVSLWRTEVLRDLGGFDEGFFMYFEDADLSLRAGAAGWKLAVVPSASAEHMAGASSSRRDAALWELASSVRVFRKYIGGSLGSKWLKRETKIFLRSLGRKENPFPRLRVLISACREKTEPLKLPDRILAILNGSPMDMPMPRTLAGARGPGWKGNKAAPWAGVRVSAKEAVITLESTGSSVTGVILGSEGEILKRFVVPAKGRREYRLSVPGGVVYIRCDCGDDEVLVGAE